MADYNTIPIVSGDIYGSNGFDPIPPPIPPSQNPLYTSNDTQQQLNQEQLKQESLPGEARFTLNSPSSMLQTSSSLISHASKSKLIEQGYSNGFIESLEKTKIAFPLRIWIVDNSGSMRTPDGNKIVVNNKNRELKIVTGCSRWAEMQQTIEYHAQLAAIAEAPTIFRLLNDPGIIAGPQQFTIAYSKYNNYPIQGNTIASDLKVALETMSNTSPAGVTPLTRHIQEIRQNVVELLPQLQRDGTKIAIILCTDGLPSDGQGYSTETVKFQFEQTLKSLEGLPVWIVVRLCTDENDIVQYWNNIDSKVEISIEVLDDFVSEATEICSHYNKWLNYGLPLHRLREMGCHNTLLDLLDERKLSKDELKQFCLLLFGKSKFQSIPDPDIDWESFYNFVNSALKDEQKQWNPIRKRMEPWIDMRVLQKEYGPASFFSYLFG